MKEISVNLSEILGLLCAEGHYSLSYSSYWGKDRGRRRYYKNKKHESIQFYNKDIKLLKHYQKLLNAEFSYFPQITKHGKIHICRRDIIRTILKHVLLGHMKWFVPAVVIMGTKHVKRGFLRGFFDGDGTASNVPRFFSTNEQGLQQVKFLLTCLGFTSTFNNPQIKPNRKPLHTLQISRKQAKSFLTLINPVSKRPGMRG